MKKILSFFAIAYCLLLIVPAQNALADYGNGETPADLTVNKEVKNPITNGFVENLGSADPTYSPDGTVTFRITVKNGSGETLNPVEVVDQLPTFLTFVGATVPSSYDAGLKRIVMKLENMIAGETRTLEVTAKISGKNTFAQNRSIFCTDNYVKVTAPARPAGDDDSADFCIQTSVAGAQNLPVAGFNDLAVLFPFLSLGGIGVFLLRVKQK